MLLDKRVPIYYILNKVKFELVYVLLVSLIVVYATHEYVEFLPDMPLTIPAFIGTAISILLSFKLNQSYDRWWEARKIWGSIVNDSRTLVLQLNALVEKGNEQTIKKITYRQIAWNYSLGQSLRGLNPLENMEKYLSEDEIEYISKHANKPLAILKLQTETIRELKDKNQLDRFSHIQIDDTLVRLCDSQGRAERIKSTVFPVTYRMFLHYIIYLFVITLSVALKDVAGYYEIPLLLVLSTAFFLLEKSARHMQDPFENKPTDTAVTSIARNIEINLRQLLNESEIPTPLKSESFYIR